MGPTIRGKENLVTLKKSPNKDDIVIKQIGRSDIESIREENTKARHDFTIEGGDERRTTTL